MKMKTGLSTIGALVLAVAMSSAMAAGGKPAARTAVSAPGSIHTLVRHAARANTHGVKQAIKPAAKPLVKSRAAKSKLAARPMARQAKHAHRLAKRHAKRLVKSHKHVAAHVVHKAAKKSGKV